VTLSGFLHSSLSVKPHFLWHALRGPGLSENDSAVTIDVCEDQNREVGLWGLSHYSGIDHRSRCQSSFHRLVTSVVNYPMYMTDRQTSDAHHRLMPLPYGAGHNDNVYNTIQLKVYHNSKSEQIDGHGQTSRNVNCKVR